jgi:hypothetical protein
MFLMNQLISQLDSMCLSFNLSTHPTIDSGMTLTLRRLMGGMWWVISAGWSYVMGGDLWL